MARKIESKNPQRTVFFTQDGISLRIGNDRALISSVQSGGYNWVLGYTVGWAESLLKAIGQVIYFSPYGQSNGEFWNPEKCDTIEFKWIGKGAIFLSGTFLGEKVGPNSICWLNGPLSNCQFDDVDEDSKVILVKN